jgi:hypothetical protein
MGAGREDIYLNRKNFLLWEKVTPFALGNGLKSL